MGIRRSSAFGVKVQGQSWTENQNYFHNKFQQHFNTSRAALPSAYAVAPPVIMRSMGWEFFYVSNTILPTEAQAKDHTWSNYKWSV